MSDMSLLNETFPNAPPDRASATDPSTENKDTSFDDLAVSVVDTAGEELVGGYWRGSIQTFRYRVVDSKTRTIRKCGNRYLYSPYPQ